MNWKPVHLVYEGGTEELRALFGKRLRVRRKLQANEHLGEGRQGPGFMLEAGAIGFVGHPIGLYAIIVFPKVADAMSVTPERMFSGRIEFDAVIIGWTDFRSHFEIEA